MKKMNAIILAGYSSKDDVICELEKVPKKGFVKLGSKTIIERQVEEFLKCDFIEKIYLAGMAEDEWDTNHPVVFVDVQGTIFDKAAHVFSNYIAKEETPSEFAMLLSADVPFIKSDMMKRFAEKCEEESGGEIDGIFYYSIVKKETYLRKFPESQRSWMKFKDIEICGGDILISQPRKLLQFKDLIDGLGNQRKSIYGQLILLDPILVIKYLFKRLTIERLLKFFNKKLLKVEKGIFAPLLIDAEAAMDVDKPEHLEVARKFYEENKSLYE